MPATDDELQYDARRFVQDALSVRIAPTLLDQFASEWDAMKKEQDAHHLEVEGLRRINTQLSLQVRQLESSLASINEEHVMSPVSLKPVEAHFRNSANWSSKLFRRVSKKSLLKKNS